MKIVESIKTKFKKTVTDEVIETIKADVKDNGLLYLSIILGGVCIGQFCTIRHLSKMLKQSGPVSITNIYK